MPPLPPASAGHGFCHNYNSYSFQIHKILSILNILVIYVNDRKFIRKNVHRGTLMSKSCNIALKKKRSDL